MTYASTRVETYVLPQDLRRVINQAAEVRRRLPSMHRVTLTREQYRRLSQLIAYQSDGRMAIDRCTIANLPIDRPSPVSRIAQPRLSV